MSLSLWSGSECKLYLNVNLFDWDAPIISIPRRPIALSQAPSLVHLCWAWKDSYLNKWHGMFTGRYSKTGLSTYGDTGESWSIMLILRWESYDLVNLEDLLGLLVCTQLPIHLPKSILVLNLLALPWCNIAVYVASCLHPIICLYQWLCKLYCSLGGLRRFMSFNYIPTICLNQ
jgi:hypothetical protein